jgi:hypothetical protein
MTTATMNTRELDVMAAAIWSFRDSVPTWTHRQTSSTATFDPFPAYPHHLDEVRDTVQHVVRCCPPLWTIDVLVADREEVGRSNGFSDVNVNSHYEGDEWVDDPKGLIMLSGKRVPPHPAVTRYLVAHEYGHHAEWMINRTQDTKSLRDETLVAEYARLRGVTSVHHGSGGRWHDGAHELMACDFRILVCEVEPDYWPHPGMPRPEAVAGVADWWAQAIDAVRVAAGEH